MIRKYILMAKHFSAIFQSDEASILTIARHLYVVSGELLIDSGEMRNA